MCCGSTRQKGRVKNRRNSDRIGWNSMWDNATRLNNQSLSSLGVHSGGLIHCAVRIRPAQPRPALDRKAAHAPHPGEAVSTLQRSPVAYPYRHQPDAELCAGDVRALSLAGAAAAR